MCLSLHIFQQLKMKNVEQHVSHTEEANQFVSARAGSLGVILCELLSDLCQMEPFLLVGHLPYRAFQVQ